MSFRKSLTTFERLNGNKDISKCVLNSNQMHYSISMVLNHLDELFLNCFKTTLQHTVKLPSALRPLVYFCRRKTFRLETADVVNDLRSKRNRRVNNDGRERNV